MAHLSEPQPVEIARAAVARFSAGGVTLPSLLRTLELVHQGAQSRPGARVLVATLEGDVHAIGQALLITLLSNTGYEVIDLGKQVAVSRIVEQARLHKPQAIGLSALLVTTSRQMPRCVEALDAAGLHIPVLVGGAAINRAFGQRSSILPDGRLYEPGVFYCKDVFEGLSTLDALLDPALRDAFIARVRAQIDTSQPTSMAERPSRGSSADLRHHGVPSPPYWGARVREVDLDEVWRTCLDRNTLFRFHWGGYRVSDADYPRLLGEEFEPWLAQLTRDALRDGWLSPGVVIGYFACNASGDALVIHDPPARLDFPRQADGERLCLADYWQAAECGQQDVVALQAVTCGPRAGQYVEELQRAGQYQRMLLVNGLASATAEALAEYAHRLVRRDLGLPQGQGLRFSWGYAACPDLDEQRRVLPLLAAHQSIGLSLTASDNLDPEHSTVAIVVHHPEAKYFSVR